MASSRPRLSVVTFTNGPVAASAASLRRLRAVADEIVVAVDHRVPIEQLGLLEQVADRLVRAEFVYPLEANLGWLHEQATGDWVLRLDGDDVPSDALVRMLSRPGWHVGITHAYLSYLWLWGSADRYIEQSPWWYDPALRLVRRDGGLAHFPTGVHEPAQVAGAGRFLDVAIYHLDLLYRDEAARAAKVAGYEGHAPGHRTDRGWAVSPTYYLPERFEPPPRTAVVPPVDAAALTTILGLARNPPPLPPPKNPALFHTAVMATDRAASPPLPHGSRVRVLAADPVTVTEGRSSWLAVLVSNLGATPLRAGALPPTRLGGRMFDEQGRQVGPELRGELTGPIGAGEDAVVRIRLPEVLPEGASRLEVGLVQEGVAWHDAVATVGLRSVPGRRVLVSAGVSTFPHLGDDLIAGQVLDALARHLPDVVPVLVAHPTGSLAERFGCEVVAGPASLPSAPGRLGDSSGRRARDLVSQARLMASGSEPQDPNVAAVLAPFAAADALVVAPGGGLASRYGDTALLPTAVEVLVARAFGLPVFVEGPSIGPLELRRDQAAVAQMLNESDRVTVRDSASGDAARRLGRAVSPIVVADPATAALDGNEIGSRLAERWLAANGIDGGRPYLVASLRGGVDDERHLAILRAVVEALPEEVAAVYLPHCTGDVTHDDAALVLGDPWASERFAVWDPSLGDRAAVGLIAGATLAVGSRFHLTVMANAAGVPSVAITTDGYDRLRLRGYRQRPGVALVERDDPPAAARAAADLWGTDRPEPGARWDPAEFAAALEAVLPGAPPLG